MCHRDCLLSLFNRVNTAVVTGVRLSLPDSVSKYSRSTTEVELLDHTVILFNCVCVAGD